MADFANVPAPMNYGPKQNIGLDILGAAGSIANAYNQTQQADQTQQFQQAYGQAYASGDRNAMKQLAAQYPTHFDEVTKGMAVLNDQNKQDVGNTAADLRVALSTGNLQTVQAAIQRNQGTIQNLGMTPDDVMQQAVTNPGQFMQTIDMIGMHALSPDKYFGVLDQKVGRDLQASGQQVQREGQQITADTARRSQDIQLGIGLQGLDLKRQANQIQYETNAYNRQRQRGIDDQAAQKNQSALTASKQSFVDGYTNALNTTNTAMQTTANVLANPKLLDSTFGFSGKINRNIPGSPEADLWGQIQQMKSQARQVGISGMKGTGSISDADAKAAQDAFLSIDENMSGKAVASAVKRWQNVIADRQKATTANAATYEKYRSELGSGQQQNNQPQAPQAAIDELQANPKLAEQFKSYYGYLPEGY